MSEGNEAKAGAGDREAAEEHALEHAWDWFSMHAGQRSQSIGHFLIIVATVTGAYGVALQAGYEFLGAVICLVGIAVVGAFWSFESRNRELVRVGEEALRTLEARLALRADIGPLRFIEAADRRRHKAASFGVANRILLSAAAVWFIAAFAFVALRGS